MLNLKKMKNKSAIIVIIFIVIVIASSIYVGFSRNKNITIRLATTTSVENSGLLSYLVDIYETENDINIEYTAVGTGQALELGRSGDVDLLLVHAPSLEIDFVKQGYGTERIPLMYNDFIIVGPIEDPARILEETDISSVLRKIFEQESVFVSRGDNSGTHFLEMSLWEKAGLSPKTDSGWYLSVGQGMGSSLNLANEKRAYILTDRGTYLSQKENLSNLIIVFGGISIEENPDFNLYNYYSLIPINVELYSHVENKLVLDFIDWITDLEIQNIISHYGLEENGIPLFIPNSDKWVELNN